MKDLFQNTAAIFIAAILISTIDCRSYAAVDNTNALPKLLPLKVVGTKILDGNNEPVRLRGVNAASLEWTSDGERHILQTVNVAIRDWHVNIIRLPLSQDRWFGKAPEQNGDSKPYRALVSQVVDECATQNCYIILDLHWSNCGVWGENIGQHNMPDAKSVEFWADVATAYRTDWFGEICHHILDRPFQPPSGQARFV